MKRCAIPICCITVALLTTSVTAETRKWTNSKGQVITAEYISSADGVAKLKYKGKIIEYSLGKLSQADRDWVEQQKQASEKKKGKVGALTGRRENVAIDTRYFKDTSEYFNGKCRRAWVKGHENGESTGDEKEWLQRDPEKDRCTIYCPPSYDGSEAYGVLLYVHFKDALLKPEWQPVLDKYKLIAVSADAVGNYVKGQGKKINPHPYRVSLSLDAMAMVEKDYKIDPTRRYVCGTSGGGHMAFSVAALYPELFKGAISSAAQSYMPSHFPGFTIRDFKRGNRKKLKWIVVSGKKDTNYKTILETGVVWEKNRLNYRFLDVPGMGHTPPNAKSLEDSLIWIDS